MNKVTTKINNIVKPRFTGSREETIQQKQNKEDLRCVLGWCCGIAAVRWGSLPPLPLHY